MQALKLQSVDRVNHGPSSEIDTVNASYNKAEIKTLCKLAAAEAQSYFFIYDQQQKRIIQIWLAYHNSIKILEHIV